MNRLILILMLLAMCSWSQDAFKNGVVAFQSKDYKKAVDYYLQADLTRPETHYNLGNAYAELGQTGLAILHFEKALYYKPGWVEAWQNLKLIEGNKEDRQEVSSALEMGGEVKAANLISINQGLWLLLFMGLSFVCVFLGHEFLDEKRRSWMYPLLVVLFVFGLPLALLTGYKVFHNETSRTAIVMHNNVQLFASETENAISVGELNEGHKVVLLTVSSERHQVEAGSGRIGYVSSKELTQIEPW